MESNPSQETQPMFPTAPADWAMLANILGQANLTLKNSILFIGKNYTLWITDILKLAQVLVTNLVGIFLFIKSFKSVANCVVSSI